MRTLYRFVLRACPASIRDEYGAALEAGAVNCIDTEVARRGPIGRLTGTVHAFADLATFVVNARRDTRTRHPRRPAFMMQDVRSALRHMRQAPWFTAAVIVMFALGIGSTVAIFSVVHGVLLRPLAIEAPDRVVEVWQSYPSRSLNQTSWAEGNAWDLIDQARVFSSVGVLHPASVSMTGLGDPERVQAAAISDGFLPAIGVKPVIGRFFDASASAVGASRDRIVISERLWLRKFNRSASIIGTHVTIDGLPRQVIGVVPTGPMWLETRDVFVPLVRTVNADRGSWEFTVVGRLAAGVTETQAVNDLKRVADNLRHFKDNDGMAITINGIDDWTASPELRRALWIMLGAVFLLLAIACVNVTNLLFVRASARSRDRAVRTALGATRADLLRESVTEAMTLASLGAVAGVALAAAMLKMIKRANPGDIPRLADVSLDPVVLVFAVVVTMAVGILTGVLPAMRSPFANLVGALREGQRGSVGDRRQDRTRSAFVVLEVGVSVVLLIGAALLVRSMNNVLHEDRGFSTDHRVTAEISVPSSYPVPKRGATVERIVERLRALPQMQSVAIVSGPMLAGGGTGMNFAAAGTSQTTDQAPWATWRLVTKEYFDAIGLTLKAGRNFTEQDKFLSPQVPRVIISERLARMIWPNENPVGKTAILWHGQTNQVGEVIGVVSDIREHRLDGLPTLEVYLPMYGNTAVTTLRLVMHTPLSVANAATAVRDVVNSIDPALPVSRVRSVEELVEQSLATRRFTMSLLATFAGLAVVLALAGVAGVLAYSMSRRRGEMGLRLALGANQSQLVTLAMRTGLAPVALGLVFGLALALWASRLMDALLYGVTARDPATYALAGAALLAAATVSCYWPARRLTCVDPSLTMRTD